MNHVTLIQNCVTLPAQLWLNFIYINEPLLRVQKINAMKNSHYIIAGLLVLLWAIVTFGFHTFRYIDVLLPIAGFIVLLQILFSKKVSKKSQKQIYNQ